LLNEQNNTYLTCLRASCRKRAFGPIPRLASRRRVCIPHHSVQALVLATATFTDFGDAPVVRDDFFGMLVRLISHGP
jgi:hypothetical protein